MQDAVLFTVKGEPEPAGSPKIIRIRNRPAIIWQKGRKWQALVAKAGAQHTMITGPCSVGIHFFMPKPKKPTFSIPATKPDIDKLARSTLDGLSGVVIEDDARVVELTVSMQYKENNEWMGAMVHVLPVDPARAVRHRQPSEKSTGATSKGARATRSRTSAAS